MKIFVNVIVFVYLTNLVVSVASLSRKPHILFVLVDDLGWSDVSFHGSKIKTPNVDKLATEGVILDNYYVQPICTPTRASLLSGRYPIHTGKYTISVWTSLGKYLLFVWLNVSSMQTGTRRIIRLDKLHSPTKSSTRQSSFLLVAFFFRVRGLIHHKPFQKHHAKPATFC